MYVEIRSFSFNDKTGDIALEIISDVNVNKTRLLLQKKQDASCLDLYEDKYFECTQEKDVLTVEFNVNEIIDVVNTKISRDQTFWDFFLINEQGRAAVTFTKNLITSECYIFEVNNLYKISPCSLGKTNHLALSLRKIDVTCKALLSVQNEKFHCKLSALSNDIEIQTLNIALCYRMQSKNNAFQYSDYIEVNHVKSSLYFEHNITETFSNLLEKTSVWDLFVKIENNLDCIYIKPIIESSTLGANTISFSSTDDYSITASINEDKGLTLTLKQKELCVPITSVLQKDTSILIEGLIPFTDFSNFSLVSKLRRAVGNTFELHTVFEKRIDVIEGIFTLCVSFGELRQFAREKDVLDLFIY